jgi:acetylornithine deacetylase/succinyl-diaminopimelate desuccinylase-like protein
MHPISVAGPIADGEIAAQVRLRNWVEAVWDDELVSEISRYIEIPCKSPAFDPDWEKRGLLLKAMRHVECWARAQSISGLSTEILTTPGRTPLLLIEIAGISKCAALIYGHLDKQPEFEGWEEGLGPWTPVVRDGRLYGRGGADDGYAVYAAVTAIAALQAQGVAHPRCIILVEGCEESGSYDLPFHLDELEHRLGTTELVICLDAECGDFERFWVNTSLRGTVIGDLSVAVLEAGVHSGAAGGIVPSSFRILRALLDRLEDAATGALLPALSVEIPNDRVRDAQATSELLDHAVAGTLENFHGAQAHARSQMIP